METNTEKFVQVFLLEEDLDILKVDYFDFEDSAFYLEVEIGDFVAWLKDNGCLGEVTNIDPLRDYLETA